jgi:hypothetical protein
MAIPTSIEIEPISYVSSDYPSFNKAIDELNAFIWNTLGGTDHCYRKGDNPYSFYISWGVIDNTLRVKEISGSLYRKEYKICFRVEEVELFLPVGLYVFARSSNYGVFRESIGSDKLVGGSGYFQGLYDSVTYEEAATKWVMNAEKEAEIASFISRLIETVKARIAKE